MEGKEQKTDKMTSSQLKLNKSQTFKQHILQNRGLKSTKRKFNENTSTSVNKSIKLYNHGLNSRHSEGGVRPAGDTSGTDELETDQPKDDKRHSEQF